MNKLRGQLTLEVPMGTLDVLLNLNAMRIACEDMKCELHELLKMGDKNPVEVIPRIYFAGYKNAFYLRNEKPVLNWDQFAAQVGTLDVDTLLKDVLESTGANDDTLGNGMGAEAPTP